MVVFKPYRRVDGINFLVPYLLPASMVDCVYIDTSKFLDSEYSIYFTVGNDNLEISKVDIKNPSTLDLIGMYLSYPDSANTVVTISPNGVISTN